MTLPLGVGPILFFHVALLAVVVTAIHRCRGLFAPPAWTTSPGAAARWRADAIDLAHEVRTTLDDGETVPFDRVQRRLLPLSSRLDRHVELAPRSVDHALVNDLHNLGVGCRVVGMELPHVARLDWTDPDGPVTAVRALAVSMETALADETDESSEEVVRV